MTVLYHSPQEIKIDDDLDIAIRRRAAMLIEDKGWWQGSYHGPKGEICALAAIYMASAELAPRRQKAVGYSVSGRMQRRLGVISFASWNDSRMDVNEVLEALRS